LAQKSLLGAVTDSENVGIHHDLGQCARNPTKQNSRCSSGLLKTDFRGEKKMPNNGAKDDGQNKVLGTKTYIAKDGSCGDAKGLFFMTVIEVIENDESGDLDVNDWTEGLIVDLEDVLNGATIRHFIYSWLDRSPPGWTLEENDQAVESPLQIDEELRFIRSLISKGESEETLYIAQDGSYGDATGLLFH